MRNWIEEEFSSEKHESYAYADTKDVLIECLVEQLKSTRAQLYSERMNSLSKERSIRKLEALNKKLSSNINNQ